MILISVGAARAAGGSLTSAPQVEIGTPVAFALSPPLASAGGTIDFGDGSVQAAIGSTFVHTYQRSGVFFVRVTALGANGSFPYASETIEVLAPTARVPVGTIYSVVPTLSPVLAGNVTPLVVTYSIANAPGFLTTNQLGLAVVVDLLGPGGRLIRRSDPQSILYSGYTPSAMQQVRIDYRTPIDAAGGYTLRAYLTTLRGTTVAVAAPIPLQIVGGPDPVPSVSAKERAAGAIEFGPGAQSPAANFNAGITTAVIARCDALSLSGIFDPISGRSDPILALTSGHIQSIASPDSLQTTKSEQGGCGGSYAVELGRTQANLPRLFGGAETVRGLDATDIARGWTYHTALGYTQLSSEGVGGQAAGLLDLTRSLGGSNDARVSVVSNADDPATFVPRTGAQPLDSTSTILQLDEGLARNLVMSASGAFSQARSAYSGQSGSASDSADDLTLGYAANRTSASFEYVDAGANMAAVGGPGAYADRAGYTAGLTLPVARMDAVSFGWSSTGTRDVVSRSTDAFTTFSLVTPSAFTSALSLRRDTASAMGTQAVSDGFALALAKSASAWSANATVSVTALHDLLDVSNASVDRTGLLSYALRHGRNTLALGLNATSVAVGSGGSAQVGESLVYGFPLLGRSQGRGYELQLEGDSTNVRTSFTGGIDRVLSALLSYHLNPHVAVGVRAELTTHQDLFPFLDTHGGAFRVRLDFEQ